LTTLNEPDSRPQVPFSPPSREKYDGKSGATFSSSPRSLWVPTYEPDTEAMSHEKGRASSPARARCRGTRGNSLPLRTRSLQAKLVQSEVRRGVLSITSSSNVARVNA
jgi:hypothetical protein